MGIARLLPPACLGACSAGLSAALYPHYAAIPFLAFAAVMPLAYVSQRIRYYARLAAYLAGMASCSTIGVLSAIALSLVGKGVNTNYFVARCFYALTSPFLGIRFSVEGGEHLKTQPAVVVGNHQTMVDIVYLGKVFPKNCSIMAKKELMWTPLLGQFMYLSSAVFINRQKRDNAVAAFAKVAEVMKKRMISLFIFPEGTRSASKEPTLLPFKKGAFHLAVAAQVPIVPIVCENYYSGYSSAEKRFDGGDYIIKVLPPISTEGYTSSSADIAKLSDKTRDAMLEAIQELAARRKEMNRLKGVFAGPESTPDVTPKVAAANSGADGNEAEPAVSNAVSS